MNQADSNLISEEIDHFGIYGSEVFTAIKDANLLYMHGSGIFAHSTLNGENERSEASMFNLADSVCIGMHASCFFHSL